MPLLCVTSGHWRTHWLATCSMISSGVDKKTLFAEMACGNITVLLNGSIVNAFNRLSMFGSVELDSLNPQKVNYINIEVVTNLEGPHLESCSRGSIVELLQILQSRGFCWTCTDNDQTLMILQCIQDPKHPSCRTCANSLVESFTVK
ncbi:ADP-ribosyl cyclase/cyclic ADP-ribose hydrolase 1-like [Anabas testudineus]|uniref:ADP-ribosyl cyclase/cyclic ADP-ribose hydrolase 1-like n=1 Tax=Anabas testudineus TaxID=64144 RepID=UPI000E459997|nr:ADP-ribosyl cyclase/cyclic ADP-ribose hydrolase 1-like [Anabas testudineus]